jgi:hypothetical protein
MLLLSQRVQVYLESAEDSLLFPFEGVVDYDLWASRHASTSVSGVHMSETRLCPDERGHVCENLSNVQRHVPLTQVKN